MPSLPEGHTIDVLIRMGWDEATARRITEGLRSTGTSMRQMMDSMKASTGVANPQIMKVYAEAIQKAAYEYKNLRRETALAEAETKRVNKVFKDAAAENFKKDVEALRNRITSSTGGNARANVLQALGLSPDQLKAANQELSRVRDGVKEMTMALEKSGLSPEVSRAAAEELRAQQIQMRKEFTEARLNSMQSVRLREVGMTLFATGASITAPMIASATQYAQKYRDLTPEANRFTDAQDKQTVASDRLGRTITSVVTPAMEQLADLMERVSIFAQNNPGLVDAAFKTGLSIAAVGGVLMAIGQTLATVQRIVLLMRSPEFIKFLEPVANVAKGAVPVAAGGAAVGLGAVIGNEVVKALGNTPFFNRPDLKDHTLEDTFKELKTAIASVVGLIPDAINGFLTFKKMLDEAGAIIVKTFKDTAVDIAAGISRFVLNIQDAVLALREGLAKFINGILSTAASFAEKAGLTDVADSLRKARDPKAMDRTINMPAENGAGVMPVNIGSQYTEERNALYAQGEQNINWGAAGSKKQNQAEFDKAIAFSEAFYKAQQDAINATVRPALGKLLSDFVQGGFKEAGDSISKFVQGVLGSIGVDTGGAKKENQPAMAPEAVRAFIEYKRGEAQAEKQYRQQIQDLARQDGIARQKAERDHATALKKIEVDRQQAERDLRSKFALESTQKLIEFQRNEAEIKRKHDLDWLLKEKEHNLKLYDLAAARDVAGYVQENRAWDLQKQQDMLQTEFDKRERQRKYDQENSDRQRQFQYELDQNNIHAQDKITEENAQYEREKREREIANQEQLAQLKIQHDREKQQRDMAFSEQLADLAGNIAGLKEIQRQYYADMEKDAKAFTDSQGEYLRKLYKQALGDLPATNGGTSKPVVPTHTKNPPEFAMGGSFTVGRDGALFRAHVGERVDILPINTERRSVIVNINNTVGDVATRTMLDEMRNLAVNDIAAVLEEVVANHG